VITESSGPGIDGLELLRHIRHDSATASIPVLILSHKKEMMDQWGGFMMGADDYLTKPCAPEIVECHIRAILRRCLSPAFHCKDAETQKVM
jgi:DNA-binding response OmpR family regulator